MSHFTKIETDNQFTSPELLVTALTKLGYKDVEYFSEAVTLKDYYAVRGKADQTQALANIIVPFSSNQQRCTSDFGYLEVEGKLNLNADSMDTYRLSQELPKLQQAYNQLKVEAMVNNIKETAKTLNKGTPEIELTEDTGKIQVKIAYPADIRRHNQLKQQNIRR